MKKIVVCGFMLLAAASMSLLSSCDDKVISSESAVDKSQTATVEIHARYNSSTASDGVEGYSTVPSARMILTAPNNKLGNSEAKGNYIQEVTLADKVTISLPATSEGVEYTAAFTNFVAGYKKGADDEKSYIFKGALQGDLKNLKPGEYRIVKVVYTKDKLITF
jgi:lipoprotein